MGSRMRRRALSRSNRRCDLRGGHSGFPCSRRKRRRGKAEKEPSGAVWKHSKKHLILWARYSILYYIPIRGAFFRTAVLTSPARGKSSSNSHKSRCVGMADDADSKSVGGNTVWVQVPPPAPRRNGLCSIQKAQPVGRAFLIPLRHSSFSPQNYF